MEQEFPRIPRRGWAEMIRKVYEADPLICPSCGGQMSIISFIEDHKVIDRIIAHLKLSFIAEMPPPPQVHQPEPLFFLRMQISWRDYSSGTKSKTEFPPSPVQV